MELKDFKAFYKKHGTKVWFAVIFGIIIVITLGCLFLPEIFWDKFIYRYYWGPLEVDALESGPVVQDDGYEINQGYTLVSEITYGIVLILALYGLFRLLERFKIRIDLKMTLSILPFIFLGGALRVMEDAELYQEPYVYLIISPLIYFLIGALIVGLLLYYTAVERKENYSRKVKLALAWKPFVIFDLTYALIYIFGSESFNFMVNPFVPIALSIGLFFFLMLYTRREDRFDGYFSLFIFGLFLLAFSVFVLMLWPEIPAWRNAYGNAHDGLDISTEPLAYPMVLGISLGITFLVYMLGRVLSKKREVWGIFTNPMNLLIVFGQMFDAAATFVGVDFYGYAEKHPIPDFFFETFGTSAVFLPIKLALACAVVYLIDVSFSEELNDYPVLKGLIKIVIMVLGLAPGTRDMLRTGLGI
ncbi:MAG: DUF63 family protein [Thermoplasmata archaeon]|nr:MAG: DUF63 family protein [Thermoplasmata archaeon]